MDGKREETGIKADLKAIIPTYMMPKRIHSVDRLLKNQNGKIDRVGLAEVYLDSN